MIVGSGKADAPQFSFTGLCTVNAAHLPPAQYASAVPVTAHPSKNAGKYNIQHCFPCHYAAVYAGILKTCQNITY